MYILNKIRILIVHYGAIDHNKQQTGFWREHFETAQSHTISKNSSNRSIIDHIINSIVQIIHC